MTKGKFERARSHISVEVPRFRFDQSCGYSDVRLTADGKYRCQVCQRLMPNGYEAALRGAGIALPRPEKQP